MIPWLWLCYRYAYDNTLRPDDAEALSHGHVEAPALGAEANPVR